MKEKKSDILLYTDGVGTPYYEPVIKSIRDFLKNIEDIDGSEGGAIIFFQKKNTDEQDLMMQVFPFKESSFTKNEDKHPLKVEDRNEILKKINIKKAYQRFWHFEQFKKHNCSDEHCYSPVPLENILTYDTKKIKYHTTDLSTKKKTQKHSTWAEFNSDFKKGLIEKNTYEQLLFESGCKGVSFIPIPVLSTPSILLVLNHRDLDDNKKGTLRSLYFRSRDTVDSYLYSRLLDSLIPYLETYGEEWKEEQLVEAFVNEICNIILPISYKINNGNEIFYYNDWPKENFESKYNLPLLDGKYNVEFNLTSFHYVDLEKPTNKNWDWIHKSNIYKSNCYQSSLLICKLFKLLHNNWKLIKSAEERAYIKISQTINHIDIKGLKETVENVEKEFEEINKKKESLGIYAPTNLLSIDKDKIFLTIDGEELISPSDFGKNTVAQQSGFIYLKHILAESKTHGNKIKFSYLDLYSEVTVPKKGKVDFDISDKKLDASKTISENANNICIFLNNYYNSQ